MVFPSIHIGSILKALVCIFVGVTAGGFLGGFVFAQAIEEARNPRREMNFPARVSDPSGLEAQIGKLAAEHQEKVDKGFIAIALVRGGMVREFYYGSDAEPLDHTSMRGAVFEIASITKTFTALTVAKMVTEKRLSLSLELGQLLPDWSLSPSVSKVTLEKLLTHHSGFPRLPSNLQFIFILNPYAKYLLDDLKKELSALHFSNQDEYLYSNLGFGVLSVAISDHEGVEFGALVKREIFDPLGLESIFSSRHSVEKLRIMQPHRKGEMMPVWDNPTLAGAGAFLATLPDMARYTQFMCGGLEVKDLGAARQMVTKKRAEAGSINKSIGLGWHIDSINEIEVRWHDGATWGSTSYIGFIEDSSEGVVVLSNSGQSVRRIGEKLLNLLHYHTADSALQ